MNIKNKIIYHLVSAFFHLSSLLPLWIHYRLSDGIYYLLYYIVRYRRRIVRKNLVASFPEKSEKEIRSIERGFYSWFCDYFVETVKMLTMSERQMRRRMKFEGTEQIQRYFDQGQSCAVYLGHYCNWEWITSLPLHLHDGISSQIYHKLESPAIDTFFLKLRSRFGAVNIEMDDTFKTIATWKRDSQVNIVGYIADQVPGLHNVHLWVDFLHHDTPVFTGAEKINVLTGAKVFYADVTRPRRGYYVCRFIEMTPPETGYVKFFYTREYFRLLEASINRNPAYWLWSHNRWKRTREQFNQEYSPEEQKRMLNRL